MPERVEQIEYRGTTYARQPGSPHKAHRRYFTPPRGSGREALHREIWKAERGPIPDGWHVHHVDGDPLNNAIDNLACVSPQTHGELHAEEFREQRREHADRIRPLTKAWHSSDEGRAWHSENARRAWADRKPSVIACAWCGAESKRHFTEREGVRFCSRRCSRAAADAEHRYDHRAPCPVCGEEFWQNRYRPKPRTCGRACTQELLRRERAAIRPPA